MGHANHMRKTIHRDDCFVTIIVIRLQTALVASQPWLVYHGTTSWILVVVYKRLIRWPTRLQAQMQFQLRCLTRYLEDLYRYFTHLQAVTGQ